MCVKGTPPLLPMEMVGVSIEWNTFNSSLPLNIHNTSSAFINILLHSNSILISVQMSLYIYNRVRICNVTEEWMARTDLTF